MSESEKLKAKLREEFEAELYVVVAELLEELEVRWALVAKRWEEWTR
jgi:hypothetical protein